jgi:hypothetical protein
MTPPKDKKKEEPASQANDKKLKILAAGDLHSDSTLAEKLADKAEKEHVDLVILTGDITHFDKLSDNMMGPFVKRKLKVLFVPGNHDSFATSDFLAEMYGVKNIHGYSVKYKEIGIFGCGGAHVGPSTAFDEKEMMGYLEKGFKNIETLKRKIMVTHVHPSGTTGEKMSAFLKGSDAVRKAIDKFKPDVLLCSHVHEAEGLEEVIGKTKVINVGRKGKIIEL